MKHTLTITAEDGSLSYVSNDGQDRPLSNMQILGMLAMVNTLLIGGTMADVIAQQLAVKMKTNEPEKGNEKQSD